MKIERYFKNFWNRKKYPMGTNYYWREPNFVPPTDEDSWSEKLGKHIGKSSAGWCFGLHVYPEHWDVNYTITNLDDWKKLFFTTGSIILNEYHEPISPVRMLRTIECRFWDRNSVSSEIELSRNHAKRGPNNLLRHTHRATPGEGTYDYITGDFS